MLGHPARPFRDRVKRFARGYANGRNRRYVAVGARVGEGRKSHRSGPLDETYVGGKAATGNYPGAASPVASPRLSLFFLMGLKRLKNWWVHQDSNLGPAD